MKKLLFAALSLWLAALCFARAGGGIQNPPTTNLLTDDRIRNTVAVDPDGYSSNRRFYVTTFGLQRFDGSVNHQRFAPLPRPGTLYRFGIRNNGYGFGWDFTHLDPDPYMMDDPVFNLPGTISPNCYSEEDFVSLNGYYDTTLTYTDAVQRPEAYMRYYSGTGSWASPVLYKDDIGANHLIILNKSGCLMSVDVSQDDLSVDWKVDLRAPERDHDPNAFKFEFMATPVLFDNKLYIAGIKQIHVVDLSSGTLQNSHNCPAVAGDDYFETPLVPDTQPAPDTNFYVISRRGIPYVFDGNQAHPISTTAPLGISQSPPIIDSDGHVYFVTQSSTGPKLSFVAQENRTLGNDPSALLMQSVNLPIYGVAGIKSQILTDFTQNMYMLSDNYFIRLNELYDFNSASSPLDPVIYSATSPDD